ncbi:MAG: hypothetical protein R3A47_01025 [Polyangiales bacterium]
MPKSCRTGSLNSPCAKTLREEPDNSDLAWTTLRLAHDLHGTGGSYGFDDVSKQAGIVENWDREVENEKAHLTGR